MFDSPYATRAVLATLALAGALASPTASAIKVGDSVPVVDGNFDNNLNGWKLLVPTGEYFLGFAPASPGNVGSNFGLQQLDGWGSRFNASGIYQDISGLTVGAQYTISFYSLVNHTSDPKATEYWNVTFGDQTLKGTTISTNDVWVKDTLTFTATKTTQRLTFASVFLGYTPGATPEVLNLDGISMTVSAVPEPDAAAMGLAGLLALGFAARRKNLRERQA